MTTDTDETATMLPGLELENREQLGETTSMRAAVQATITALEEDGLLKPRHVALCQLALELADSVAAGRRSGRASAAAMAAAQLRETLLALPSPQEAEAGEAFNAWVDRVLEKERQHDDVG